MDDKTRYGRLVFSLTSHFTEIKAIEKKISNPMVCSEKVAKLKERLRVIKNVVIPRIERDMSKCALI